MTPEWFATIKTAQLGRFELYHLKDDTGEKIDLVTTEPERLASMKLIMEKLFGEIKLDAPVWEQDTDLKSLSHCAKLKFAGFNDISVLTHHL